jgi:predicted PurR-regulated permease PerM
VAISFSVIQGIDNYFVTPYVLGGEVSLSALSTILIIICGGFLWGIAGMILFIPMLSIAKIIFDHIPSLQHIGALIGEKGERPSSSIAGWVGRLFGEKKKK